MFLIIPILINIAAGALERGAGVAIARWAGGNIAKKYIATVVSKKAIEEARKLSLGESKDWQAAFRENPGEALREAANDFVKAEIRDAFSKPPKVNENLVELYRESLIENTGKVLHQELKSVISEPTNLIVQLDTEKIIDRTNGDVISKGISWTEEKDVINRGESQILNRNVIGGGESQILNRDVISRGESQILNKNVIGGSSPIEVKKVLEHKQQIEYVNQITTRDIIESAGKNAFYDSFDEQHLTYTVIGPDDALAGKVRSPLEAIMEEVFDINEEA